MEDSDIQSSKSFLSYLDYILNPQKLHVDLQGQQTNGYQCASATLLIKNFVEKMLVTACEQKDEIEIDNIVMADNETVLDILWNKLESDKTYTFKLLALQAAAHINWNLDLIQENLTISIQFALLISFLQLMGISQQNLSSLQNLQEINAEQYFPLLLYHLWRMKTFVALNLPKKRIRGSAPGLPLPTSMSMQIDSPSPWYIQSNANTIFSQEIIIAHLIDDLSSSKNYVEHFLDEVKLSEDILVPDCAKLSKTSGRVSCLHTLPSLTAECALSLISYHMATVMFLEERHQAALSLFESCVLWASSLTSASPHQYFNVDLTTLEGYLHTCWSVVGDEENQALLATVRGLDGSKEKRESAVRQYVTSISTGNIKDLIKILESDNISMDLPWTLRINIEDDLRNCNVDDLDLNMIRCLTICRCLCEGKPLLCGLLYWITSNMTSQLPTLLQKLDDILKVKRSNTMCTNYITSAFSYWCTLDTMSAADEHQLVYKSKKQLGIDIEIKHTEIKKEKDGVGEEIVSSSPDLLNVYERLGKSTQFNEMCKLLSYVQRLLSVDNVCIEYISGAWSLPERYARFLQTENSRHIGRDNVSRRQAMHILLGRGCQAIAVRDFNLARQLLTSAMTDLRTGFHPALLYTCKWDLLLVDLRNVSDTSNLDALRKQVYTCLTTIKSTQLDVMPPDELVEECAAFLMNNSNIEDWNYLSELKSSNSMYLRTSAILVNGCRGMSKTDSGSALGLTSLLWECVLLMLQHERQKALVNDHNGSAKELINIRLPSSSINRETFCKTIKRIEVVSVLNTVISCISKLYQIVSEEELNYEKHYLWPSTVPHIKLISTSQVRSLLLFILHYCLSFHPNASWNKLAADIHFGRKHFSKALGYYLEAASINSNWFCQQIAKEYMNSEILRKLIDCCSILKLHVQTAMLCQWQDPPDYSTAFKSLQQIEEVENYDGDDKYYDCFWEMSVLECLTYVHSTRGHEEKVQLVLKQISKSDLNCNNPPVAFEQAKELRRVKMWRMMCDEYCFPT